MMTKKKQEPQPIKTKIDWQVAICAIICITSLEAWALYLGHDGLILSATLAIIAGIAGYKLRK